jgi:hypothetical protein
MQGGGRICDKDDDDSSMTDDFGEGGDPDNGKGCKRGRICDEDKTKAT